MAKTGTSVLGLLKGRLTVGALQVLCELLVPRDRHDHGSDHDDDGDVPQ